MIEAGGKIQLAEAHPLSLTRRSGNSADNGGPCRRLKGGLRPSRLLSPVGWPGEFVPRCFRQICSTGGLGWVE